MRASGFENDWAEPKVRRGVDGESCKDALHVPRVCRVQVIDLTGMRRLVAAGKQRRFCSSPHFLMVLDNMPLLSLCPSSSILSN